VKTQREEAHALLRRPRSPKSNLVSAETLLNFENILNYSWRFRASLPTISWKRVPGDEATTAKMARNGASFTIAWRARRETALAG
jgi:hypothetical protein